MAQIKLEKVSKAFSTGNHTVSALKEISLEIEKGEIYGIIGMSGAGKSTLVRCLNFLEKPTSGKVYVEGEDLAGLSEKTLREKRRSIAMIFQHFHLLMQKNVLDNIAFPLIIQGMSRKKAREKARDLLKVVNLEEKEKAYPGQLSGGQKQRVAIARALASNPHILLCDEATSALDPQTTASILELLKEINESLGITIVIITHQMEVIREICHRVAIMEEGKLVEEGRVEEIFDHPKSKVGRKLIIGEFRANKPGKETDILQGDRTLRIVFTENSAFEPVIANMILRIGEPVNILKADTKNVNGIAKGEMILGVSEHRYQEIVEYMKEKGLEVEEVKEHVEY